MEVIPPKETLCLGYLFPQELESYKTKIAEETGENELEWEGDDADEDFDIHDEYNYDVRKAFDVWRWVNGNILVFSLYRAFYIL